MSNIKGLDLIRDAYMNAISQNVASNNFTQSKLLLDSLETLSLRFVSMPKTSSSLDSEVIEAYLPSDVQKTLFDVDRIGTRDHGVSNDIMRQFILDYLSDCISATASAVANAFYDKYGNFLSSYDKDVPTRESAPRWRNRFQGEAGKMRREGILMPREKPNSFTYTLSQKYIDSKLLKISLN